MALVLLMGTGCSDGGPGDLAADGGTTVPSSTTAPPSTTGPEASPSTTLSTTDGTQPGITDAQPEPTIGPGLPPSTPPSQPVVTGGGSVATGLAADPACEGPRARVRLSWQPAATTEQMVAVSARPDGLETGNYTTSGVLGATASTYELQESQPGGIYYWRVLNRRDDGWAASETAQFEGPTCVSF